MDVAHDGLVHCDPCECKVKGFFAVSSIERNVSKEALAKGATTMIVIGWQMIVGQFVLE